MTLADRVYRYGERRFQSSGCTEWPTVREVARALRVRQQQVWDEVDGDDPRLMGSYYLVEWDPPIGDWFVETVRVQLTPDDHSEEA